MSLELTDDFPFPYITLLGSLYTDLFATVSSGMEPCR
jgi:hypothetical protein